MKASKSVDRSQKSGDSPKRSVPAKPPGGSPKHDASPKRAAGPAKSASAAKDAASAKSPTGGASQKPKSASPKREADSTRRASAGSAASSKAPESSATRGSPPKRDAVTASEKPSAPSKPADSSKQGGSPAKDAPAKPKASRGSPGRSASDKASVPAKVTTAPSSKQPDAASVQEAPSVRADSGTPGLSSSGRKGSVVRIVRELTSRVLLPLVGSRGSPDAEHKSAPSSSPEVRPKLVQPPRSPEAVQKPVPNSSPEVKPNMTQPSKRQHQQVGAQASPASPARARGFRRWLKERNRRARSAQGIPYEDESKSSVSVGNPLLRAAAIAAVAVAVCVFILAITLRVLGGPKGGRVIERSPLDINVNDSESRAGRSSTGPYEELFRDSVDVGASPCSSFYEYACGAWIRNHNVSSAATTRRKLARIVAQRFRDEKVTARRGHPVGEAAWFFETCLNAGNRGVDSEGLAVADVKNILAEANLTWPDWSERSDFVSSLFFMARRVALPVFFGIEVGYSENAKRAVLFPLDAPFQRIMRRFREHVKTGRAREVIRVAYQTFTAGAFDGQRCDDVLDTVLMLTGVIDVYVNAVDKKQQDDIASLLVHTPTVTAEKWGFLLKRYHKVYFFEMEAVVIYDVASFVGIFEALQNRGEETMNDALGFLSVLAAVHYTNTSLRHAFFGSVDEAIGQQELYCFARTYKFYEHALNSFLFGSVSGSLQEFRLLVQKMSGMFSRSIRVNKTVPGGTFPSSQGYNLRSIFDSVEKSRPEFFEPHYARYPNLTASALQNWMSLVEHMSNAGALPLREFVEEGIEQDWSGQCGTSFYKWRLTPCHLSFPWYVPSGHRGVLLAGLGARIAAALFLDYVDRNATSRLEVYQRNHACLSASTPLSDTSLDLRLQASVAAVQAAWMMYEDERAKNASLFPDVGPVTSPRVFFLFGCHLFCGQSEGPRMCNLPLRHSTDFARVFGCRRESGMNPGRRCTMII